MPYPATMMHDPAAHPQTQRVISYVEAIREATEQAMARDPNVVCFGLDVDDPKAIQGTTRGLRERFGHERVFGTPLSEDAMTGVAIGMALAGLRPIHVHIRMDFLMLAMNQLVNMAAKAKAMYGGKAAVPMVVRSMIGKSWGQGPQHSQALHSFFMHVPGLKVVAPTNPFDAKGTLLAALADHGPVMYVEHRLLHARSGPVPAALYETPPGAARIVAEGRDVTLVGISYMLHECFKARALLLPLGITAEIIDPIWLSPLDAGTIAESAARTGRLLVADNGWTACGAGAEIITRVIERLQGRSTPAVARVGFASTTCPTTPSLEKVFYPNAATIAAAAQRLVTGHSAALPEAIAADDEIPFKGPF